MINLKSAILSLCLILLSACEVNIHLEDPEQAGNTAADFAEQLFIEKNSKKAHLLFHEEFKKILSEAELSKLIEATKEELNVTYIEAVSFDSNLGQSGHIAIYLEIERDNGVKGFMEVTTIGDSNAGYSIIGLKTLAEIQREGDLPGEKFSERQSKIERRT